MHLFTIKDIKDLGSNQFEWERNFGDRWKSGYVGIRGFGEAGMWIFNSPGL